MILVVYLGHGIFLSGSSSFDLFYDSPPLNQRRSLTNVSWLLDKREDPIESNVSTYFLVCKGLSNNDVGVSRDTVLQEVRPGAGFETGDSVEEKLGGLP